ncbi:MAG: IMPACT family protein [Oscillospiraceae bacterium]
MEDYLVPRGVGQAEYIEKKSRFLGGVYPVTSEQEAKEILERVRKQHYDARHNCWCYILKSGQKRYSDDGEPQGTAGQPMLNVFEREGVVDVLCIVTRYFGGILLGAGGLCRAYTKAAKDALDAAGISKMQPWLRQQITVSYALFERAKLLIAAQEGTVEDAQYGADILITYRIPEGADERLRTALREASSGSVVPSLLEEIFCAG